MTNGAPVPTTNALPNSDKGPPIGPIVGGTIGGAALIVAVVAGVWFCLQKRRKDQDKPEAYATTHHQSLPPAMPPQPYFYYSGSDKISVPANNYPQQQQWVPGPGVSPTTTPPPVPSYIQQITQQPAPQSARQSQTYQQPQMHILQPQSLDPLVANSQNQQPQVQDPPIQHVDALGQPNQNPDKDSNFQKYSTWMRAIQYQVFNIQDGVKIWSSVAQGVSDRYFPAFFFSDFLQWIFGLGYAVFTKYLS